MGEESSGESYALQPGTADGGGGGGPSSGYSHLSPSTTSFHVQPGGLLLACQHCPFRASSHAELTGHLTAMHRDLKPPGSEGSGGGGIKIEGFLYPCDKCEFRSVTAQALRKHRQTAHNPETGEDGGASSRYSCAKCEYSSTSRINYRSHVARAHGKTHLGQVDEAAGSCKKEEDEDVAEHSQQASGFQTAIMPLYATATSGVNGEALVRLQPAAGGGLAAGSVLPVYHLTVKGPDHHIFTFHPAPPPHQAAAKAELVTTYGHHPAMNMPPKEDGSPPQQQQTFMPIVNKNGEYSYHHHQQQGHSSTANGGPAVSEAVWRPEYDSYLGSV